MAYLINLTTYQDNKGLLTVGDGILPFDMKRFYFMKNNNYARAECSHKKSTQALICIVGSCNVYINDGINEKNIKLDSSDKCLIIESNDWHKIDNFSFDSVLMVLSSNTYDKEDYEFKLPIIREE